MALANYTDLIASINGSAKWLHRNDLSDIAPDWVTLCETTLNNGDMEVLKVPRLRTGSQETAWTSASSAPARTSANVQTVALPSDLLEMRQLYITANGIRRELKPRPISPMSETEENVSSSIPRNYWVIGSTLYLDPIPDQTYDLTGDYYAKIGPLATSGTNWLMTAAPMVYLAGSITHGALWLGPQFVAGPWAQGWAAAFRSAVHGVVQADVQKRFANLRQAPTEASMMQGRPFDLVTGT